MKQSVHSPVTNSPDKASAALTNSPRLVIKPSKSWEHKGPRTLAAHWSSQSLCVRTLCFPLHASSSCFHLDAAHIRTD